jgi:hypothetical protein
LEVPPAVMFSVNFKEEELARVRERAKRGI